MTEMQVGQIDDIADGSARLVQVGDLEIAIIRHGSGYYAYQNVCPHQGGPACEGIRMPAVVDIIDENGIFAGQKFNDADVHIVCPWHGYEFHLADGCNVINKSLKLRKFDVSTRDGSLYLSI